MLARTGLETVLVDQPPAPAAAAPLPLLLRSLSNRTTIAATSGDGLRPSIVAPPAQGEIASVRGIASRRRARSRPWRSTSACGPRSITTIALSPPNSRWEISWARLLCRAVDERRVDGELAIEVAARERQRRHGHDPDRDDQARAPRHQAGDLSPAGPRPSRRRARLRARTHRQRAFVSSRNRRACAWTPSCPLASKQRIESAAAGRCFTEARFQRERSVAPPRIRIVKLESGMSGRPTSFVTRCPSSDFVSGR